MKPRTLARLDTSAGVLLLLWTGMALGFALLTAPVLFRALARPQAGQLAGWILGRLDLAAWIAFAGAFLLAAGSRWLGEVPEEGPIGALRLWTAAALAALLICFASSFILGPRLRELQFHPGAWAEGHPERAAFQRAHGISRQFLILRMLLALGLAAGIRALPGLPGPGRQDASEA